MSSWSFLISSDLSFSRSSLLSRSHCFFSSMSTSTLDFQRCWSVLWKSMSLFAIVVDLWGRRLPAPAAPASRVLLRPSYSVPYDSSNEASSGTLSLTALPVASACLVRSRELRGPLSLICAVLDRSRMERRLQSDGSSLEISALRAFLCYKSFFVCSGVGFL